MFSVPTQWVVTRKHEDIIKDLKENGVIEQTTESIPIAEFSEGSAYSSPSQTMFLSPPAPINYNDEDRENEEPMDGITVRSGTKTRFAANISSSIMPIPVGSKLPRSRPAGILKKADSPFTEL